MTEQRLDEIEADLCEMVGHSALLLYTELAAEIRRLRSWVDELTGGIHWDE